jgi:hypothetical protein
LVPPASGKGALSIHEKRRRQRRRDQPYGRVGRRAGPTGDRRRK